MTATPPPAEPSPRGPMPDPQDFSREPERPVFARLAELDIAYANIVHPPTRTVADSRLVKTDIGGGHTKSLFMKDKRGSLVLVSAWAESELPLNRLHRALAVQRLSFTDAALLWDALGVTPGSVSALALMNDSEGRVRFVIDAALLAFDVVNFHPLRNDMTTSLARDDLLRFVASTKREPIVVDFTQLGAATDEA